MLTLTQEHSRTILTKLQHLVLPGICLALLSTVSTVQYLRNEVIDAKQSDYVKTARSKGVPVKKSLLRTHLQKLYFTNCSILRILYYWIIQWWYLRRNNLRLPRNGTTVLPKYSR